LRILLGGSSTILDLVANSSRLGQTVGEVR
jgi:hypothetical protein